MDFYGMTEFALWVFGDIFLQSVGIIIAFSIALSIIGAVLNIFTID